MTRPDLAALRRNADVDPTTLALACGAEVKDSEPRSITFSAQAWAAFCEAEDALRAQPVALNDAATSLETISRLAGRVTYGDPPIETYMSTFSDVRLYAAARAKVAREALASAPPAPSSAPAHQQLMKFYGVDTLAALVDAQAYHVEKLQAKLPPTPSLAPQRVREG
jgi:hypothetical protein